MTFGSSLFVFQIDTSQYHNSIGLEDIRETASGLEMKVDIAVAQTELVTSLYEIETFWRLE